MRKYIVNIAILFYGAYPYHFIFIQTKIEYTRFLRTVKEIIYTAAARTGMLFNSRDGTYHV